MTVRIRRSLGGKNRLLYECMRENVSVKITVVSGELCVTRLMHGSLIILNPVLWGNQENLRRPNAPRYCTHRRLVYLVYALSVEAALVFFRVGAWPCRA